MSFKINEEQISFPKQIKNTLIIRKMSLNYLKSERAKMHHRLQVFFYKGTQCVVPGCQHKGEFILETAVLNKKGRIMGFHLDIYTKDFVLMTVDHHISRSRGGSDMLENKFPMCEKHNTRKGNLSPEEFYSQFQ